MAWNSKEISTAKGAVVLAASVISALLVVPAQARSWRFIPDVHSSTEASFVSRAAIVKFSGRTKQVKGEGEINVENPAVSPKGEVIVDLTSLDTGIALRNEHMRGMLEAAKYPNATFKLKQLKAPKLIAAQAVAGVAMGDFTLHGVTRAIKAPVTLTFLPETEHDYRAGDWVAVSTEFKLKLSDYRIALPKPVLGIKVADELTISLDGMAKAVD